MDLCHQTEKFPVGKIREIDEETPSITHYELLLVLDEAAGDRVFPEGDTWKRDRRIDGKGPGI